MILLPGAALWILLNFSQIPKSITYLGVFTGSSIIALSVFFAFVAHPNFGRFLVLVIFFASIFLIAAHPRRLKNQFLHPSFLEPLLLVFGVALLIWSSGMITFSPETSYTVSKTRYLGPITPDSRIPLLFAKRLFFEYESIRPFLLGWLSSDRPPLQTGFSLTLMPFWWNATQQYHVLGVLLQSKVFGGISFAIMEKFGSRKLQKLALFLCIFSGFTMLQGFYVWPKMLSATFVFLVYGLTFAQVSSASSKWRWIKWTGVGAGAACAMLAHGGSLFAFLPLMAGFLVRGKCPGLKEVVLTITAFSLLYGPWVFYQKVIDPPGNRLIKWHLAGVIDVDERGSFDTLKEAYSDLDFADWLDGRITNAQILFPDWKDITDAVTLSQFEQAFPLVKWESRHHFFAIPGIATIGWIFLPILFFRRDCLARESLTMIGIFMAGLFIWCLLIYTPGRTYPHHGAYFLNYISIIAPMTLMFLISPKLTFILSVLNFLMCYVMWISPGMFHHLNAETIYSSPFLSEMYPVAWLTICAIIAMLLLPAKQATRT